MSRSVDVLLGEIPMAIDPSGICRFWRLTCEACSTRWTMLMVRTDEGQDPDLSIAMVAHCLSSLVSVAAFIAAVGVTDPVNWSKPTRMCGTCV